MKLDKKKELATRTLNVGKERIVFSKGRLDEIKEAITRQDIKDLVKDKAIILKPRKGTKKQVKRKTRRREGSIKKTVNVRKRNYMTITRKLRALLFELRDKKIITRENFYQLRKEIRAKSFRSKAHMKERITQIVKENKDAKS